MLNTGAAWKRRRRMLQLRKLLPLLMLWACSKTPSVVSPTTLTSPKCAIPAWPIAPNLFEVTEGCPDGTVCLTIPSVLDLAAWAHAITEEQRILGKCDSITVYAPPTTDAGMSVGPENYDANHTMPGQGSAH